jgi:ParB family chromosome partitioning protein
MSIETVIVNPASSVPGLAWDDVQAVEKIVEIAKRINRNGGGLGLEGEDREIAGNRSLRIMNIANMKERFYSAQKLADVLRKGDSDARRYAAEIEDALQMRLPFAYGSQEEPRQATAAPVAEAAKVTVKDAPPALPQAAPQSSAVTQSPKPAAASSDTLKQGWRVPRAAPLGSDPAVSVKVTELKTAEPFDSLFPCDQNKVEAIATDIKTHGYDKAHPVVAWEERGVVIDGHTRLAAAKRAGLTEIPVVFKKFASEDEALSYAVHEQRNRRNLTDADIVRLVDALDKRRSRGRNHRAEEAREEIASSEVYKTSAAETAKRIGVSKTRVENARAVSDSNDAALMEAVATGQMSLHKAAVKARAAKKPVKLPDPVKVAEKVAAALNTHTAELRSCGNLYEWACDILADVSAKLQEAAKTQGTGTAA